MDACADVLLRPRLRATDSPTSRCVCVSVLCCHHPPPSPPTNTHSCCQVHRVPAPQLHPLLQRCHTRVRAGQPQHWQPPRTPQGWHVCGQPACHPLDLCVDTDAPHPALLAGHWGRTQPAHTGGTSATRVVVVVVEVVCAHVCVCACWAWLCALLTTCVNSASKPLNTQHSRPFFPPTSTLFHPSNQTTGPQGTAAADV